MKKHKAISQSPQRSGILRRLNEEPVIIPYCDGTQRLAQATDVFTGWIDSFFKDWRVDKPGRSTPKTATDIYELCARATLQKMFDSLTEDSNKMVFEQHQIIEFVRTYPNWLNPRGWATFFLFEARGYNPSVVVVFRNAVGTMSVRSWGLAEDYEEDNVWDAESGHRIVVPRLNIPRT